MANIRFDTANKLIASLRYKDAERVRQECYAVLQQVPFLSAKASRLNGTIQTYYHGVAYQTPVCIYIPEMYPTYPPIAYLRPTPDMFVVNGHRHVDPSGLVYLPYLADWNPRTSNLIDMIGAMASVFSETPPLRAKPKGAPLGPIQPAQPMYMPDMVRSAHVPSYPDGQGAGVANPAYKPDSAMYQPYPAVGGLGYFLPQQQQQQQNTANAGVGATAAVGQNRQGAPLVTNAASSSIPLAAKVKTEADKKRELVNELNDILATELQQYLVKLRDGIDESVATAENLRKRAARAAGVLTALNQELAVQREYIENTDRRAAAASSWIADHTDVIAPVNISSARKSVRHKSHSRRGSSAVAPDPDGGSVASGATDTAGLSTPAMDGPMDATPIDVPITMEELVVPPSKLQEQLLECVAEDAAIDDIYYHYDTALRANKIDCDTMLKEIRDLARRQFKLRALARQIDTALAGEAQHMMALHQSSSPPAVVQAAAAPMAATSALQAAKPYDPYQWQPTGSIVASTAGGMYPAIRR